MKPIIKIIWIIYLSICFYESTVAVSMMLRGEDIDVIHWGALITLAIEAGFFIDWLRRKNKEGGKTGDGTVS